MNKWELIIGWPVTEAETYEFDAEPQMFVPDNGDFVSYRGYTDGKRVAVSFCPRTTIGWLLHEL